MDWYPLLLAPYLKETSWGGTRLLTDFGFPATSPSTGEAWVLSCRPEGPSEVQNGPLAGRLLPDVLTEWGTASLGIRSSGFPDFPLLIKLIDAKAPLSLQVHPNDAYAARTGDGHGKTEMWYVLDCEPGAKLVYGVNCGLTRGEFRRRAEEGSLTDICNLVPVHPGDVFFLPGGTLHAVGEGILIAEIQQNADTTYRVSDYGRVGLDGKPRPLHIDKAAEAVVTVPPQIPYGAVGRISSLPGGTVRPLASCDLFQAELLAVSGRMRIGCADSFTSLLCLEGQGRLLWPDGELLLHKGASLFLPAGMTAIAAGDLRLLCSRV